MRNDTPDRSKSAAGQALTLQRRRGSAQANGGHSRLIEDDWVSLPRGLSVDPLRWLFREGSFDPVTRTRRGRLYEPQPSQEQPNLQIVAPHPYDDPMMRQVGAGGRVAKTLYTYTACNRLLNLPNQGQGMTLNSLSAFAIIPAANDAQVAREHWCEVEATIERVMNSAFREAPTSVVDHCRTALTVLHRSFGSIRDTRWGGEARGHHFLGHGQ